MTLAERAQGVLDVPLHRFLGLRFIDAERPQDGLEFDVVGDALNIVGVLHGGIFAAVIDAAAYLALLPELADDEGAVTHDLSVSLMRSATAGSRVRVRGRLVRKGGRIAFARSEAEVDGDVVAIGNVTKSILQRRS